MTAFAPSLAAARERLAAVQPEAYARTRNHLDGAVTRLSPYLTHGFLTLREVYDSVHARTPLPPEHKLVFEWGWRAYWHHVWAQRGDGIHQSLHVGLLPESAYATEMPADVLQACTGLAVIDQTVRTLYDTGYLHNHARMWLASYVVHLRKVHWHTGAQWMLAHLLDGDCASNHLSWQWIAGTGSSKPYLFNADNVARFAPPAWHSFGTVLDQSYEALDSLARSPAALGPGRYAPTSAAALGSGQGVAPPGVFHRPPGAHSQSPLPAQPQGAQQAWGAPAAELVQGRAVWLLHPWSVGAACHAEPDTLVIGLGLAECHQVQPLSARRWQFVQAGLQAQTPHLWWGTATQVAQALGQARSIAWQTDLHWDRAMATMQAHWQAQAAAPRLHPHDPPALFAPVQAHCSSFTQWWRKTRVLAPDAS